MREYRMMKRMLIAAAAGATFVSGAAQADIRVTTTPGTNPYVGGTTFDFDATTPATSCPTCIVSGSVGNQYAQPFGGTGKYFSVGPSTTPFATITLSRVGAYWLSFIWGSVDKYNAVAFFDSNSNLLKGFTGADVAPADGDRTDPSNNPVVTFHFSGTDAARVSKILFISTGNTFEVDNIRVVGVPEPTTWGMMILGFGMIGGVMRRRPSRKLSLV
jgi:PEP-CTERM motif